MRVSLKARVELAQSDHVVDVTEAGKGQSDIEGRSLVAGGPDDAVAVGPVGMFRVVLGNMEIERGGNVHDGKRAAGVA